MATASAGRADKGLSRAPARSARPCSAIALRSAGRAGAKRSSCQTPLPLQSKPSASGVPYADLHRED